MVEGGPQDSARPDIRSGFDRVPDVYDRVRPTYPEVFFERLFEMAGEAPAIVEVGPGTGQATQALLDRGARVTAVEVGPYLARFLADRCADRVGLAVVQGAFEAVELPAGAFDAIVSATAYHWIEPEAQLERPHRLLRAGGVLAVIDLIQTDSAVDRGYFARVQPIYDAFGEGRGSAKLPRGDDAVPPMAPRLEADDRYHAVDVQRVEWNQTYTSQQYRDLLMTYSGTQAMAEPQRSDLVEQLVAVLDDEFDGTLTRPLVATLTAARTRQR